MPDFLTNPAVLTGIGLGSAGCLLLLQSRLQVRMLRRRVATGAGTAIVDPATGLFTAAAAWQSIRGEANRARRLGLPLDVWIGTSEEPGSLDAHGRALLDALPPGSLGVRLGRDRVCVLSCAQPETPESMPVELDWRTHRVPPTSEAAAQALAFVSEAVGA